MGEISAAKKPGKKSDSKVAVAVKMPIEDVAGSGTRNAVDHGIGTQLKWIIHQVVSFYVIGVIDMDSKSIFKRIFIT